MRGHPDDWDERRRHVRDLLASVGSPGKGLLIGPALKEEADLRERTANAITLQGYDVVASPNLGIDEGYDEWLRPLLGEGFDMIFPILTTERGLTEVISQLDYIRQRVGKGPLKAGRAFLMEGINERKVMGGLMRGYQTSVPAEPFDGEPALVFKIKCAVQMSAYHDLL